MYLTLVIAATSTPGPAVLFIMTNSTLHGWRKAAFAALAPLVGENDDFLNPIKQKVQSGRVFIIDRFRHNVKNEDLPPMVLVQWIQEKNHLAYLSHKRKNSN